jgi:hypothetical protein
MAPDVRNSQRRKLGIGALILLLPAAGYALFRVQSSRTSAPATATSKTAPTSSTAGYAADADDAAVDLQRRLDSGAAKLTFEPAQGYLRSLLQNFKIPESSQTLVFAKSSFQLDHISPQSPRALYFNDDVYVGFVPTGPVIEIAAEDPKLGPVFYTISREETDRPKIEPQSQTRNCIVCHDSSSNDNPIPRLLMLSVLPNSAGNALRAQSLLTNDQSPMVERWGGFYVTGTHGAQRHLGNMVVRLPASEIDSIKSAIPRLNLDPGANVTDLSTRFDTKQYPQPNSDIVALLLLAHQTHVHNLITLASYEVSEAAKLHPDTVDKLVKEDGDLLVNAMLFSGAVAFTDTIKGTSGFAEEFSSRGIRDSHGRSLKDLDLQRRLLKYPMSYLIYSKSFDSMPAPVLDYVYRRFRQILTGVDKSPAFAHLSEEDRANILGILQETKPAFLAAMAK